jgi:hypothetical protein
MRTRYCLCGGNPRGSALSFAVQAAEKDTKPPEIPTCDKKIGTLAVSEPQNPRSMALQLKSPAALIKVFVPQCKCFKLPDRGEGLAAGEKERACRRRSDVRVDCRT